MCRRWRGMAVIAATLVVSPAVRAETSSGATASVPAVRRAPSLTQVPSRRHLADYDSELRRADGRVDVDALAGRLKELGVSAYYWLIWHAPTDWDDLKLFLPKAATAGVEVWVYLVPPSEGSGTAGPPSQPFGLDFNRWGEEIARLSLQHTNLTAWVIDDFYANHRTLTPDYLREVQARAKRINPNLAFLPLMYFNELRPKFVEEYRAVIDGVVVAYLHDREEIEQTWALLNDATLPSASAMAFPGSTPSRPGDFVIARQEARVLSGGRYAIRFQERDDFTGPTAGYHFKQLLLNEAVVWEEDVAGGSNGWQQVSVDVTSRVRGQTNVNLAFRLFDRKGVSNFGVHWQLRDMRLENLEVAAGLDAPQNWQVSRQGAFETGFGAPPRRGEGRFHIPFFSMTAGDAAEFRLRHGNPATPERIAAQLRLSLEAWRDGKCDGVVTYCLDKGPHSSVFPLVQGLFREFKTARSAQ